MPCGRIWTISQLSTHKMQSYSIAMFLKYKKLPLSFLAILNQPHFINITLYHSANICIYSMCWVNDPGITFLCGGNSQTNSDQTWYVIPHNWSVWGAYQPIAGQPASDLSDIPSPTLTDTSVNIIAMSTSEYLNRFRSGFIEI